MTEAQNPWHKVTAWAWASFRFEAWLRGSVRAVAAASRQAKPAVIAASNPAGFRVPTSPRRFGLEAESGWIKMCPVELEDPAARSYCPPRCFLVESPNFLRSALPLPARLPSPAPPRELVVSRTTHSTRGAVL